MADFSRIGYSQVEPNFLTGIVEGKIPAQLPVDTTKMGTIIENGRFAKYDYATGKVNLTGNGPWYMIYNEEKLYDERYQAHKDFAMIADNYADKEIYPRLILVEIGDVITTNAFGGVAASNTATVTATGFEPAVGNFLTIGTDGYLAKAASKPESGDCFEVVKVYTMADGQAGVKIRKIQ